ncbi:MAG: BrnT family toxin [Lachnospiraceae bacterium]|nr:BrnT family toxin [Lachnospiraceae bacterium]
MAETLVEWDEIKSRTNIQKHGISFETAALVFADDEAPELTLEQYAEMAALAKKRR